MRSRRITLVSGGTDGMGAAVCIELVKQGRLVIAGQLPEESEIAELWQSELQNVLIMYGDQS